MGGLLPLPKESHKFVQIYFMGGDQAEAQQRCANGLYLEIVMELQEMFYKYHKYVEHIALIKEEKIIIRADKRPGGEHEKKYNAQCRR